jgi:DNA-directed RNA polymerase sigma subunit (sigma70/sigma32)
VTVADRESVLRARLRALAELPLLSAGEELAAAATVADGRAAEYELAALGAVVDVGGELDVAAAEVLTARVRRGEDAHDLLVRSSRRLVVAVARRHDADGPGTEALLAVGDEALERAADRYDPAGGLPFSVFAKWWIERAMREVDRHPASGRPGAPEPVDAEVLTALGHLHAEDARVIELRLGLQGGPPLSSDDTARVLGIDSDLEHEREERAVAKLRHPCTPGDLTHLRDL